MSRLAVIISYLSRHVFWMLFVVACDTFDGDSPAKEIIVSEIDYYVLPGSSIVIDLI